MNASGNRRLTLGLAIAVVILLVACGWLYWQLTWLRIQVAWAVGQTRVFDDMRKQSSNYSDPALVAGSLEYAAHYYTSGSKQDPGSFLDEIVERSRNEAVRDIIAVLRTQTAEDLGDDPQPWIDKYVEE